MDRLPIWRLWRLYHRIGTYEYRRHFSIAFLSLYFWRANFKEEGQSRPRSWRSFFPPFATVPLGVDLDEETLRDVALAHQYPIAQREMSRLMNEHGPILYELIEEINGSKA